MKKILSVVLMTVMVFGIAMVPNVAEAKTYSKCVKEYGNFAPKADKKLKKMEDKIRKNWKNVKIIKGDDSSYKKLHKRKGKKTRYVTYELYMIDKDGFGVSQEFEEDYYCAGLKKYGLKKGSLVVCYFVWCKGCNNDDDILKRYDVIIRRK